MWSKVAAGFVVLAAAIVIGWFVLSSNPTTPAGYVGYVTQGAVMGKARFLGLQKGPTSYGRTWLADVVNVSITPYTYDEDFTGSNGVLSKDNLKLQFRVHIVWQVDASRVQQFVEQFTTLQTTDSSDQMVQKAYNNFIKEPLRTYSRAEIQKYDGFDVKDNIDGVGDEIFKKIQRLTKDTPFKVTSVVVGNIQYPNMVADAVADKLAEKQRKEKADLAVLTAQAEALRKAADAKGVADAMQIINQQLTPEYIQYLAIEAQSKMVNGPNHTVVYIPSGPMGVPIAGTFSLVPEDGAAAKTPVNTGGGGTR